MEVRNLLLVGIDWADTEHTFCVMDEAGGVVTSGTIPHTPEGVTHLVSTLRARATAPADVCVALETRQGPLVGALLDEGFTIYAINPKAVDRHRERFRVAGTKSDQRDAWVLATLLRTDRQLYRAIQPDSELAQELRVLTRDRVALVQTRTMASNQLTAALKAYFPEFLELFGDPDRPVALAVLQTFSTREALMHAGPRRLGAFLRQHHYPRSDAKAQEIHLRLQRPAFRIAPVIVRTKSRLALALVRQLDTLAEQIAAYDGEIRLVLKTHPDGELYHSLPGAGDLLAARMVGELGDNRERYDDAAVAQCEAGTAPITRASGTVRTVHVRRACIHPLRETMWQFAFCSLQNCMWAREYYNRARDRGKHHAEAIRMLANVWLRIIVAMRRECRRYEEAIFLQARQIHLSMAS